MSRRNGYYLEAVRWLKSSRKNRRHILESRNDTVLFPYEVSFWKVKLDLYRVCIHKMIKHI